MLKTGPAVRVIIHVNDDISSRENFLHEEILQFLFDQGVAGATLLRVQAGFGTHHRMHTEGTVGTEGEHLPVRIEFVDSRATVDSLLPALLELVTDGIVEAQETTILKAATGRRETPQSRRV